MFNTGTQIMTHTSGRKMMTHESAKAVAEMFRAIGGFTRIEVSELGYNTGCWCVELWSVNAKAGNRTLTTVDHMPTEKEAKLLAKKAKGKASERDNEALGRMAAEREVNRE